MVTDHRRRHLLPWRNRQRVRLLTERLVDAPEQVKSTRMFLNVLMIVHHAVANVEKHQEIGDLGDLGAVSYCDPATVEATAARSSGKAADWGSRGHRYEKLLDEQRIIRRLLEDSDSDYDWRVRPRGSLDRNYENGPVNVEVNMYLRSISKVDDVNMEYSLHFTFREEWVDERLYFNSPVLKHIILTPGQRIWAPDTFFQNEKDGKKHDIDTPNVLMRVHNGTGRILYSCRLTLTLSCPMRSVRGVMVSMDAFQAFDGGSIPPERRNIFAIVQRLVDYPLDVQTCVADFASYAYTTKDIMYHWKNVKPIQIKEGLRQSLPSFLLSAVKTDVCTSNTTTGSYSCLRTVIELKREFSYYLLQLYIPSFMLVAVSWVSFWLDKDSVPARVTLGVTTLLTMTTQASGVNANLPPVSYTKAIDIWIGVCLGTSIMAAWRMALSLRIRIDHGTRVVVVDFVSFLDERGLLSFDTWSIGLRSGEEAGQSAAEMNSENWRDTTLESLWRDERGRRLAGRSMNPQKSAEFCRQR
ncbi:unnamed protein product [Caenorhabditis auriculariae]|uniref:Uncharacterized protein n=1 Tax=Caenorhabditis auriculariae TaxID=2777116 RepID=A0A8S1HM77_9PELO|nr:unnamed protein product [Caenorhabditis auriculariae]